MSLQHRAVLELRRLMDEQGVSQAELGRRVGMTSQQLHVIFSCQRPNGVTLKTLERIAEGLDVRMELVAVRSPFREALDAIDEVQA